MRQTCSGDLPGGTPRCGRRGAALFSLGEWSLRMFGKDLVFLIIVLWRIALFYGCVFQDIDAFKGSDQLSNGSGFQPGVACEGGRRTAKPSQPHRTFDNLETFLLEGCNGT